MNCGHTASRAADAYRQTVGGTNLCLSAPFGESVLPVLKGLLAEAMYAPPAIAQTHVAAHEKCIAADNNHNKRSGVDKEKKMFNEK